MSCRPRRLPGRHPFHGQAGFPAKCVLSCPRTIACFSSDRYPVLLDRPQQSQPVFQLGLGYPRWTAAPAGRSNTPSCLIQDQIGAFTNWAPGEPGSDDTKRCVMVRNDTGVMLWYTADCGDSAYPICQKQRCKDPILCSFYLAFQTDKASPPAIRPRVRSSDHLPDCHVQCEFSDLLPPGVWKAVVRSEGGPCSIQARAQSWIQVTPTIRDETPCRLTSDSCKTFTATWRRPTPTSNPVRKL
jgi:hypothetical protein